LLKLDDKSSFPSGITANITGNLTGTASKATADASGNTITSTYETKTDATAKLEEAKAYADTAVANLVDTAPEALNTLNELAAALGDDANFATTVSTNIGKKANSSITITAGNGLTGGGTLAANRTLAVGAGTGISVSADAVSLATVADLTAGTYGPSANVSGSNNATMNVPEITVDTYGRVTKVTNRVYTAKNTTYSNFVKSGSGAKAGLVPAPSTTAGTTKYLREDGTWTAPPNTNYYHTRDYSTGLKISTGTGVEDMYVPEGTTNTLGVVKQHTSNDCTSYTSDSGATTPAAVKKAFGLFNAVSASKVLHSLSVNGKSFDGSSDITVGTISTSYGGTGATTLRGARNNLLYLAPTIKTNADDTTAKWGELGPGTISFYSTAAQLID
jgi:hypothetical protein